MAVVCGGGRAEARREGRKMAVALGGHYLILFVCENEGAFLWKLYMGTGDGQRRRLDFLFPT